MPKRKRTDYDEYAGDRHLRMRKQSAQNELVRSKKLLHRALKTAKGFERQKLCKRLKLATANNQPGEVKRINREMEVLKTLDVGKATDAQLHRALLKVKEFRKSEVLPEEVGRDLPRPEGGEDEIKALHNVTSNMCKARVVRDVIIDMVGRMYIAMGIPTPVKGGKGEEGKKEMRPAVGKKNGIVNDEDGDPQSQIKEEDEENGLDEASWDVFDTNREIKTDEDEGQGEGQDSLDDEELKRYDALLGASSGEESFHEEDYIPRTKSEPTNRFSFSPTPSLSPSISLSPSPLPTPEPELRLRKTPRMKSEPAKAGGSTFLPTLMGGYWSGSESEPSDLEDARPVRKNRPGQMARRAIWEKKYGDKAEHIKSGKGPVADARSRDDGWDPKRGARDTFGRGRGRGRGSNARGGAKSMNRKERRTLMGGTGENAVAIQPRRDTPKKRDDVGVLHPSWQAAKKAKEMKNMASFQGKKVTFD